MYCTVLYCTVLLACAVLLMSRVQLCCTTVLVILNANSRHLGRLERVQLLLAASQIVLDGFKIALAHLLQVVGEP